jgi:hypothetical protein
VSKSEGEESKVIGVVAVVPTQIEVLALLKVKAGVGVTVTGTATLGEAHTFEVIGSIVSALA